MSNSLDNLQPAALWKHFFALSAIPRPSHHEEQVRAYLVECGKQAGAEVVVDGVGNVILRKPASPGYEKHPGVILQGHMDMVPQANSDSSHDFTRDPLQLVRDGDWIRASGTTLGADNGIGVAAALAMISEPNLKHGPLEVLVTSNEEDGMDGAFGLEAGVLQGDYLVNLDSEEEGELCIGCAGGANVDLRGQYPEQDLAADFDLLQISLRGLKGGHSGCDIHRGRGNANKLLARLVRPLLQGGALLIRFQGGTLRNAIPREAGALLAVQDASSAQEILQRMSGEIRQELAATEPDMILEISDSAEESVKLPPATLASGLIDALCSAPNGVLRMSDAMAGLVETSTNLAIVELGAGEVRIRNLVRSFVDSARDNLCQDLLSHFRLLDLQGEINGAYPGWKPDTDSALLRRVGEIYRGLFDKPAVVGAIHAGLECGILGAKYPNWRMLSFGPTIQFPHSPDERVHIPSVGRFWQLLTKTLETLDD